MHRLGKESNDESSIFYWASQNKMPIFCPALTTCSSISTLPNAKPGFVLNINEDIRKSTIWHCNLPVRSSSKTNIANYSAFANTGRECNGSDSGASRVQMRRRVGWGKIRIDAKPIKVCANVSLIFPLIISQTFAKHVEEWKESVEDCVCWIEDSWVEWKMGSV